MRLSKSNKYQLALKTSQLVFDPLIDKITLNMKKVGDQIYDLIINTYNLKEFKNYPNWFQSSILKVVFSNHGIENILKCNIEVEFSDYKPWGTSIRLPYFTLKQNPLIYNEKTYILLNAYNDLKINQDEALIEKTQFKQEIEKSLVNINTVKQLKENIPSLYILYKEIYEIEKPVIDFLVPNIQYNELNTKITSLLDKCSN
jgi:hypothetical protein